MSSREVEKWYPVFHPTYKDFYEVSTLGRVRSKDWSFPHPRNPEHLIHKKGKIIKQCINKKGYLEVGLHRKGVSKTFRVHRLVALSIIPNDTPDITPLVNHIDADKTNNSVSNLEWVSHLGNMAHAKSMGLLEGRYTTSGEERKNHKLDWDKVRYIRENKGKLSQSYLAELFGVCKTTIARIQRNEKWKESNNAI
jgi:DNA-binding transcriptional regulator YiaG